MHPMREELTPESTQQYAASKPRKGGTQVVDKGELEQGRKKWILERLFQKQEYLTADSVKEAYGQWVAPDEEEAK